MKITTKEIIHRLHTIEKSMQTIIEALGGTLDALDLEIALEKVSGCKQHLKGHLDGKLQGTLPVIS